MNQEKRRGGSFDVCRGCLDFDELYLDVLKDTRRLSHLLREDGVSRTESLKKSILMPGWYKDVHYEKETDNRYDWQAAGRVPVKR